MQNPLLRRWLPFLTIVPAMLALDRISKQWVVSQFELHETLPIAPPFLYITRSFNTGIAFGLGSDWGDLFLILSLCVTAVIVFFYIRSAPEAIWQRVGLSLTIGGALGNIIDRLETGQVVDFFHIVIPGLISNVSNFADHAIVIGVIIILIDDLWRSRQSMIAELAAEEAALQTNSEIPQPPI